MPFAKPRTIIAVFFAFLMTHKTITKKKKNKKRRDKTFLRNISHCYNIPLYGKEKKKM